MRLGIFLGLEGRAKVCPLFELRGVVLHYIISAKYWSSNWSILHLVCWTVHAPLQNCHHFLGGCV